MRPSENRSPRRSCVGILACDPVPMPGRFPRGNGMRVGTLNRVLAYAAGMLPALALVVGVSSLGAADVTYERLLDPEPLNWLMNHHDFGAQRFSALGAINRSNVKGLKLAFAIALACTSNDEY